MSITWPHIHGNLIAPLIQGGHHVAVNGLVSHSSEKLVGLRSNENAFGEITVPDSKEYEKLIIREQGIVDTEIMEKFEKLKVRGIRHSGVELRHQESTLKNHLRVLYLHQLYYQEFSHSADITIFIRPDLLPVEKLNCERYFAHKAKIKTPKWGSWGGYNDRFAIINGEAIEQYFNRGSRLLEYIELNKSHHSESFLKWALKGIDVAEVVTEKMLRVRAGGVVETREDFVVPKKYHPLQPRYRFLPFYGFAKELHFRYRGKYALWQEKNRHTNINNVSP